MKKFILTSCIVGSALLAPAQKRDFLNQVYDYIENTSVFEQNQEDGHVLLVPYITTQEALARDREKSAGFLSLDGTWKFYYAETPEGTPAGFYESDFEDSDWKAITVPGNWEMQGFGDPLFRNVTTPFKPNPPAVPREYNPTGSYRRNFDLPATWKGKEVFLRLEKTASASFIWINGKEAGYNEGGQEPAEYNITSLLKPGRNTIAVNVIKYSDGYYLENQDYWRLAGIFDKVWLFATPPVHIFDWFATTDLDENYRDAQLSLAVEVKNYAGPASRSFTLRATLYDNRQMAVKTLISQPFTVRQDSPQTILLADKVTNPNKWSAESPDLYSLVIELIDASGKTAEIISGRIGFKETEIRNQVFYLNGKPVKLNGINSHMQHPDLGHAMDVETIRKDFSLLKQFNINCVRTSHYPPVNEYLDLADEYGIYIVDETGDESHATEFVSELKEWEGMYRERARKMVLRDRNHPSILFWSAGNESGEGNNICAVIEEGKKLDPTRYWMYGGNAFTHPCEDIIGPRYYTPFEMVTFVGMVPDSIDPRPSFMDEYLSVAGNGGGGLDDYWEMINSYPRSMGGAIWDFVSPGLREKVRSLKDDSPNQVPAHVMGRAKLTEGRSGKAIDLNGHDQWVEVYRSNAVEISGDKLTLSLWIYPRALNSSAGTLLTKGSYQFGLQQIGKDSVEFYLTTGRRYAVRERLPANWENNWHHVVAIYDGSEMRISIDGINNATKKAAGNIKNLPFPVNIGRNAEIHGQETSDYLCDALIDQVGIFSAVVEPGQLVNPGNELRKQASIWLDFEEIQEQGEFFSIGIGARTYGSIWPDRRPQPEMWQIKKSGQPVTFRLINAESGLLEITNRYLFTNLRNLKQTWILTADGTVIDQGTLSVELEPLGRTAVRIPVRKSEIKPGVDYQLTVSFLQKENQLGVPAGHEIAWEQFKMPWTESEKQSVSGNMPAISIIESPDTFMVKGVRFNYLFDKKSGHMISMDYLGKQLIRSGPSLNVWRPPLANETDEWGSRSSGVIHWGEGYGRMAATDWYTTGIDHLSVKMESVSYTATEKQVVIEVRDVMTMNRPSNGFQNKYIYTIDAFGEMSIHHTVIPYGDMPAWLPRMGTSWILDKSLEQVRWYGRGPEENYPDRKSGYKIGQYASTVREMTEPYLIPQDYGLRTDNRWVELLNREGIGLRFSGNEIFNFSAWPYSMENLTKALYTYQLQPFDGITFNFDYATSGVGCTARSVFNQYRVLPERFDYVLRLKPVWE
jgi:beta-galactosidase